MGFLSRCGFKNNLVFHFHFAKQIRGATSLAHTKGPIVTENSNRKTNIVDVKIDKTTILKLERISLVDFGNEGGIERLEAAIRFAQKLKEVPLDPSAKPMYSVLENEILELREDRVTEGNCRKEILKNAKVLEDEYFVAPPGPTFMSLKEFGFAYGVQGILFRRNLEKFWFIDCVTLSKYNVFHTPSNTLMSSLKDLTDIGLTSNFPFGICEIDDVKNTWNQSLLPPKSKPITHKIAKVTTVYESDDAIGSVKDLFYKKQRERKSWWRRISERPSVYYMTEVKKEKGREYSEIQARFPENEMIPHIVIETISFKRSAKKFLPGAETNPHLRIVEHTMSLDWGCLAMLLNGCLEYKGNKELWIHPRLAPYKAYCKAIISPEDDEKTRDDLKDLTLYVIHKLREAGVESVIMNNIENPEVFKVPYIITVDSRTLETGLLKMVSQRTWCGETIHITDLPERMNNMCV